MSLADMLEGFEIVPAEDMPALTLDKHHRLYINAAARRLFDVKPYDRLALAYRIDSREIAIIKAGARLDGRQASEYQASVFAVDKRYYLHVRVLTRLYALDADKEPIRYVYNRGSSASDGDIFVFTAI